MSKSNLERVMLRIRGAEVCSPIAVFRCEEPGQLDSLFAKTVEAHRMMWEEPRSFIGLFDRTMDMSLVKQELRTFILN
jgi:hypothetical protein